MPLRKGKSDKAVAANIKTMLREGRPRDQAIAIAMHKAGRAKCRARKGQGRHKTMLEGD